MKEAKNSVRAQVRIGFDGKVYKTFRGYDAEARYENEKKCLEYLEAQGCDFVPRVLAESVDAELLLVTTNCGQPVGKLSEEKLEELFKAVEDFGVRHDDQADRNITYDAIRGRFCVIDFELAKILSEKEPEPRWGELRWASRTDVGRHRKKNDDTADGFSFDDMGLVRLEASGVRGAGEQETVFVVCDGMGGETAGDLASEMIAGKLREIIPQVRQTLGYGFEPDRQKFLEEAVLGVHASLNAVVRMKPELGKMGSTLTLAWLTPRELHFAHVGDSRLYRFRGGELVQLTRDDNRAWKMFDRGEMNERQYRSHPRQHILSQVVGAGAQFLSPQMGVERLESGDVYLLSTDGLHGPYWEKQVGEWLGKVSGSEGGEMGLLEGMMEGALDAGGTDNLSGVLFRVV